MADAAEDIRSFPVRETISASDGRVRMAHAQVHLIKAR